MPLLKQWGTACPQIQSKATDMPQPQSPAWCNSPDMQTTPTVCRMTSSAVCSWRWRHAAAIIWHALRMVDTATLGWALSDMRMT